MTASPPAWVAPGNDYRGILELEAGPPPRIAVIFPEGADRARAAVERQDYDGEFAVVDPSDDSVAHGLSEFDVILAVGQGMPAEGFLTAHARWHRRAGNVVVLGPSPDPGRSEVVRGSRLFLGNDEGFAALTPSNVSVPRTVWTANPELDVIAGWRMWNDGLFFAFDPEAVMSDQPAASEVIQLGAELALADAIPHRRFRPLPSAFHSLPKVSWVVAVESLDEATSAWEACQRSTFPDHEVVFHGPAAATGPFRRVADSNPRLTVVSADEGSFADAVAATRGELVAILDPRVSISPEGVAKAISRFEAKPAAPVVRTGYSMDGDRYLRLDDLAAIDAHIGRDGLPLFSVVTRRELSKDLAAFADPARGWSDILARCDQTLVVAPLVEMTGPVSFEPEMPGLREVMATGVREAAKEVVRTARRRRAGQATEAPQAPAGESEPVDRVSVAYVGFTGHDNLGDEAVRVAIERLMPWADFETDPIDPELLMVGGGTLINGRRYYLNRMLRQESASVQRALFGTGVRSPEYWGVTEPMDDWFSFIDSSLFAAVRGPDSVRNLRTMGYGRDLPVIGDPALYLEPPEDVARVEGRIVVCPVYTSGNLHGGSDDAVFDALARLIQERRAEGREVVMLSAFPQDDRWVIDIMRRAHAPDLPYLAGYDDIDATMALLASADLVIGERLHAAIMAAAAGTPFVGLEYRPKMRDFARSVDQETAIIRTDEMERLDEVCARLLSTRDVVAAELENSVSGYRKLQVEAAEELHRRLLGS